MIPEMMMAAGVVLAVFTAAFVFGLAATWWLCGWAARQDVSQRDEWD